MKKNNGGITLIALVVTIIILIILAGVSLNIILGDNGLINKAKGAKEKQEVATVLEKLELLKAEILIEEHQVNINNYLAKLGTEDIKEKYKVNYIESETGLNYAYVLLENKYRFLIEDTLNGNVLITHIENTEKEEIEVTATGYKGVYDGTEHEITITCIPSDAKIEYSTDGENYSTTKLKYTNLGEYTIYYKVSKLGYNTVTGSETIIIEDNIVPSQAQIEISGSTSTTSLPVTLNAKVSHIDNESGVNIEACKYVLNTSNESITDESSYTGTFSSNEESISIELTSATEYYLHVLSVDSAGNSIETIKGPITVTAKYHTHSSSCNKRCSGPSAGWYWDDEKDMSKFKCRICGGTGYVSGDDDDSGTVYYCVANTTTIGCGKNTSTIDKYTITY